MTKTRTQKARQQAARRGVLNIRRRAMNPVPSRPRPMLKRMQARPLPRPQNLQRPQPLLLNSPQKSSTTPLVLFETNRGSTPGGIRVKGREMLGSVSTSGAVTAGAFTQCNIGATLGSLLTPPSFPRLTSYTSIYEYYVFHRVKYTFQSLFPTTQVGVVMLAVDYDTSDIQPTTSLLMMRNISAVMSNAYANSSCEVLRSLSRLPKFITSSSGTSPPTTELNQARLDVAIEGITLASASSVGYIIAEYDVEFFTPQ